MRTFSLRYALFLMGFTAIVAQVTLIRELLTSFSGNELAIGIFFANWLLLEALGSYAAGRWADRVRSGIPYYVCLQVSLSVAFPVVIFLTRIAKHLLGIIPGQGMDVFSVFCASFFLLIPLSLADGAQFSFGCRMFAAHAPKGAASIGKVYIYEAVGSLVGGIIGTYLCLQYLHAFQIVGMLALLNIFSAILLLVFSASEPQERKTVVAQRLLRTPYAILKIAAVCFLLFCVLAFPLGGIEYLHQKALDMQWRNYEVLTSQNSIYGNVTVLKRFEQVNIMSTGVPIATIPTPDVAFLEEFAHLPLLAHPDPQRVLLVGGGIGGMLQELLKHPIHQVDYAELDPLIIHAAQQYAASHTASALPDPRVHVHAVDGRYLLRMTDTLYDVILLNLPDPSTLEINRFYTLEFYHMIKQHLKAHGILGFLVPGSTTYLSQEMIDLNASLIQTVTSVFPYVKIVPGEYTIVLVSPDEALTSMTPDTLIRRMYARALQTLVLSDFYIEYKFDERRLDWYRTEIGKARDIALNQDFSPSALYHDLVFWNSIHSPGFARIFPLLKRCRIWHILLVIVGIFVVCFSLRSTWRRSHIILPIIATGFTGMGVDIVLVLAFQSFYGYLYHWIGLLIAAFMIGLTFGGIRMTRRITRGIDEYAAFLKLEILIVLYTIGLIGILPLLNRLQHNAFIFFAIQFILLLLNAVCGFLVGAEFPLANTMYLQSVGHYTKTAGSIYAADLIGSWIGAVFVAIVFLPLFGTIQTCSLLLFINACSALLVYASRKKETEH